MGPAICQGCDECNTTLVQHPDDHEIPEEHNWIKKYNEDTGIPYEICSRCMTKKIS